jgi:hypothetical protein
MLAPDAALILSGVLSAALLLHSSLLGAYQACSSREGMLINLCVL